MPVLVSVVFCTIAATLALPFVMGRDAANRQTKCLFASPSNNVFSCHISVPSNSIYPRLDFKSVPAFPCNDRNQNLSSCFFDELIAQAPAFMGRENYLDFVAQYKPSEKVTARKTENSDLIAKLPRTIGGDTVAEFNASLKDVFNLVRRCLDAGLLNDAREALRDVPVVIPHQEPQVLIQLRLYELFTLVGLPDRAAPYGQQAMDSKIRVLDEGLYDVLVSTAHTDNGKTIYDYLKKYKTEAERGYYAALIIRALLRSEKDNFDLVVKLWPYAIGWCMQRNVNADIGRPVMGFYHDEDIPNTYPACLVKLLPNHRFPFLLRGH